MAIGMAVKMTLTLDDESADRLNRTAARLRKPKSHVVREAIRQYEAKSDRLSETERRRLLKIAEEILNKPPTRPQAEVDRELRELRDSRRRGWRRPSDLR